MWTTLGCRLTQPWDPMLFPAHAEAPRVLLPASVDGAAGAPRTASARGARSPEVVTKCLAFSREQRSIVSL